MNIASILFLASAIMIFPASARATTLDEAHRAFAAGNFAVSTQAYEQVLAQEGYSAPVLFDLGNSRYREGNFAQAILAYKRAQWLSPNDPDIAANLSMAQQKAGVTEVQPGPVDKFFALLSASGWAWLGCGAWTLLCLGLLARTVLPKQPAVFAFSGVASALVLVAASIALVITSRPLHEAVVIDKNASALISPFPAAQAVFTPLPGMTVTLQKSYNDFLLVADSAGHTGWINRTQLNPIIPL